MALPQEVLDRPVFAVGEQDYRWADVVAAAVQSRRWAELEQEAAQGIAALARLRESISQADLTAAMQEFRYARSLIAAEEMEAWLAHWGLRARDWSEYLRRAIARARSAGLDGAPADELDIWAEAACSGALAECARDLAALVAAAEAGGLTPGPVESDLPGMEAEHASFVRSAMTPDAAAKTLELRSADWVRLSYTTLEFPDSSMASEAAQLIRTDGLTSEDVAARAGVALHEHETFLEDVDPDLAEPLLSAPVGELMGPLPVGDSFALVSVRDKVAPTLADPVIQGRLEEEVPRRALAREVRNRVRWHEHL